MILFSVFIVVCCLFVFMQKTAYELRISDWSSDVCSSDLVTRSRCARTRRRLSTPFLISPAVHNPGAGLTVSRTLLNGVATRATSDRLAQPRTMLANGHYRTNPAPVSSPGSTAYSATPQFITLPGLRSRLGCSQ